MTGSDGQLYSEQMFRGRWVVLAFGFTACTDICPLELESLHEILDGLGDKAGRVQTLFISLDPGRDSPQALRDFIQRTDSRILGLTGDLPAVAAVAGAFRVGAHRDASGTLVHGSFLYVLGPDGAFRTLLRPAEGGAVLAKRLSALIGAP